MSYPAIQRIRKASTKEDKLQIVSMTLRPGEEIIIGQRMRQLLAQARNRGLNDEDRPLSSACWPFLRRLNAACTVQPVVYEGWQAQQVANDWVQLTFVPQLGGRLMQVTFNGHPYLFVNPVYKGKYISPAEAAGRWINYGGDKIWPLPEGNDDEQHWQGASTPLDDGAYAFSVLSQGAKCTVRLEGPPDPPTGLQYTREISIGSDSPQISFHAITRNFTGHSITWSVQSVSQYNLSDAKDATQYNHEFWAFTPLNPRSSYLLGYHARDGLANDPAYSVKDGLFRLNWKYLESEVWLDSIAGWVALIDGATQYAMVEKTKHVLGGDYPGKATIIFYKNGPTVELDAKGMPYLTSRSLEKTPYYMEAELNSPMAVLGPGESYAFDTTLVPLTPQRRFHHRDRRRFGGQASGRPAHRRQDRALRQPSAFSFLESSRLTSTTREV